MNDLSATDTPLYCRMCKSLDACARLYGEHLKWAYDHCDLGPSASGQKIHETQTEPFLQIKLGDPQFNDGGSKPFHGRGSFFRITAAGACGADNPFREVSHKGEFCLEATAARRDIMMEINIIGHNNLPLNIRG